MHRTMRFACAVLALGGGLAALPEPVIAEDVTTCRVLDICAEGACGVEADFTTLFLSDDDGRLLLEFDAVGDPLLLTRLDPAWSGAQVWGETFGAETTLLMVEPDTGRLSVLSFPDPAMGHSAIVMAECERS